jgi:hypothetical protein
MDSYGIVVIGDYLLSIPGLVLYLLVVFGGLLLIDTLARGIPFRYRFFYLITYGLIAATIISWGFSAVGLNFYVEA